MTKVNYHERNFEIPLLIELSAGAHDLYSPDQVLEKAVGFDAAVFCALSQFWGNWGQKPGHGVVLTPRWFRLENKANVEFIYSMQKASISTGLTKHE